MKVKTKQPPAFRVGDRVTVPLGRRNVTGFVVEERGAIGVGGRYLYRVEVPMEPYEPMEMLLPEEEMTAATDEPAPIEPKEVVKYLVNGGLVSILYQNIGGGRNQPLAWLCRDTLGNVTHTFLAERGLVGGRIIPFHALYEKTVFGPKAEAVTAFVESFGVSRQEAERVVAAVGIAR